MCKIFIMCTELFARDSVKHKLGEWSLPNNKYAPERATLDPQQWEEAPLHLHNNYTREMQPSPPR